MIKSRGNRFKTLALVVELSCSTTSVRHVEERCGADCKSYVKIITSELYTVRCIA